jgi:hypothetical protein
MITFFDFLNSVNENKRDLLKEDPANVSEYVPFMVNRGLSYFPDTVMFANEMNQHASIPKEWQYAFYLNGVSKRRRFSKWSKRDATPEDVSLVMRAYQYSSEKAISALKLLTIEQLEEMRAAETKGGK